MSTNTATQDPEDLEALFDSIVAANGADDSPSALAVADASSAKVINQIGQMARSLHDSLRELGLNKQIEKAVSDMPDARDRLNYVASLTERAAEKVLNATEAAQPLVEKMGADAQHLAGQWQLLFDKKLDVEQFKALVMQTCSYLNEVPKQSRDTNSYLMEIIMAQDFQDLTGQVIKTIITVTKDMEQKLLLLLLENAPPEIRAELNTGLLNGPVVNPNGRTDIVSNQDQVDDLLESLGF